MNNLLGQHEFRGNHNDYWETECKKARVQNAKLREAAQDVVDRWDSPLWKDLPHTGLVIQKLREALAEVKP